MPFDVQAALKESKAEYRQLGKSGLRVSVPILGAMSIGSKEWQDWVRSADYTFELKCHELTEQLHVQVIEEDEALPLLKAAYDRGITTWDTGTPWPVSMF